MCNYCTNRKKYQECVIYIETDKGSGTGVVLSQDGYFVIMLKEDLLYFSQNYTTYTKARIFDNIDLGEIEWTPIGNEDTPFTGTFDGNNYKITNLKITTGREYNGLFGYCDYVQF